MTDRYNAIVVVLENDIRDDDATPVLAAIRQIRGVASVTPNVADMNAHIAAEAAKSALRGQLIDVLWPKETR